MEQIMTKLDRLAEVRVGRDSLDVEKRAIIDSVLPQEIKVLLEEIEAEFGDKFRMADDEISALEGEIKIGVLAHGKTVKGSRLMAVWNRGRVSWDDERLQGYAKAHPELAEFRKQGEPTISIRKV